MGEIIGYLKDDATHGEDLVLRTLALALPDDCQVYVECPLCHKGMERMPDFIVLTNYGVVVLEVKDWVQVDGADKYYVSVRTRAGEVRKEKNPVGKAREFAQILASHLQKSPSLVNAAQQLRVPWGYAAVLPNLPTSSITQLRRPWGEAYVLGIPDLRYDVVTQRLKATLPHDVDLHRDELDAIRAVVNPSVSFTVKTEKTTRHVVLDRVQEQLVSEVAKQVEEPKGVPPPVPPIAQAALFAAAEPAPPAPKAPEAPPPEVEQLTHSHAIRLVRGVAGSGKTLVLIQRARYLAAQHPTWEIAVITYNLRLTKVLQANLKGSRNVKVTNFDKLCSVLLSQARPWREPSGPLGWVKNRAAGWPVVNELGAEFVSAELRWIKEVGIQTRAAYLTIERKGRGDEHRLERSGRQRTELYDILEAYDGWLAQQSAYDWADVPGLVVEGIKSGAISPPQYDAILVDEAQDFAPSWFDVLTRCARDEGGLIFLADDPSQSIYRNYSWREKGLPVVGRTRWLRVPYRNTREIYQAAYEVIRNDEVLRRDLEGQLGGVAEPDLTSPHLRSGPRPHALGFRSEAEELVFIRSEITWLLEHGYDAREIAVLHRRTQGQRKLKEALAGTGVETETFHTLKGLEFEAVFLTQMQHAFPEGIEKSPQALSEERRLVYMAMTRARECLYMTYEGRWPDPLRDVLTHADCR